METSFRRIKLFFTWKLFLILFTILLLGCAPSLTELKPSLSFEDSGRIWFASAGSLVRSPDGSRFLFGDPVILSGDLEFPSGKGPFPAVILAHGCSGITKTQIRWASFLRSLGYATFIIDSFTERGLREVCTNPRTLTSTQRIPDVYGALRILATHPKINSRRVALMGFSHGGGLTISASTVWAKKTFAPSGHPSFCAFIAFYPSCNITYPELEQISAPLRIHTGELDDWTPAEPCIKLVKKLKALGQDSEITVYSGAHHGFDGLTIPPLYRPDVYGLGDCYIQIPSLLGPFPPSNEVEKCLKKGATIGWNQEVTEQARRNVKNQLAELLK